jgi:hypothetical protein
MIKTFRDRIATGETQKIRIRTNNGLTGYKIVKFEVVTINPVSSSPEAVLKIFTTESTATADAVIDFTVPTLIASAFYENHGNSYDFGGNVITSDTKKFNQDLFITCSSTDGDMNYHLELEQVKLAIDEATVATLKDMRAS